MYSFFFANAQTHAHFSNQYLSRSCTHTRTTHQCLIFLRLLVVTSSVNHVAWLTAFRLLIEVGDNARNVFVWTCVSEWVRLTAMFECERTYAYVCVCVCVFNMFTYEYGCFVWSVCLLRRPYTLKLRVHHKASSIRTTAQCVSYARQSI